MPQSVGVQVPQRTLPATAKVPGSASPPRMGSPHCGANAAHTPCRKVQARPENRTRTGRGREQACRSRGVVCEVLYVW